MTSTPSPTPATPATNSGMPDYILKNAELNFYSREDGSIQYGKDREAARSYFLNEINPNTVYFGSLREKLNYLVAEGYYEAEFLEKYDPEFVKTLFQSVYNKKFRFQSFVSALKFYGGGYALKMRDQNRFLERFEDRVAIVALYLGQGEEDQAMKLAEEMISGRYQPATPTFLNSGKQARGELISCFLLNVRDEISGIMRAVTDSAQLSKKGGGVALNLSSLRAKEDPIKGIPGAASGVIPVMKILEDTFSYANQLGARQGAGAVYLNAHHLDIMDFLDTKRENADEKVRIKTLSLGVVIPDITFELARNNEDMYLFSPYDMQKVYGKEFAWLNISEVYREAVDNPAIRKTKINPRQFLSTLAEIQMESGYPYIMFEDAVNRANQLDGKITMSNLCVTGDTLILTDNGYRKAEDLYNTQEDFSVAVDDRARLMDGTKATLSIQTSTKMFKTAENADVFELTTNEGHRIKATEWHKFYAERNGEIVKLQMNELVPGDKLLMQPAKGTFGTLNRPASAKMDAEDNSLTQVAQDLFESDEETQRAYISKFFELNSSFNFEMGYESVKLQSGSETLLVDVQRLLLNFGIYGRIYKAASEWVLFISSPEALGRLFVMLPWVEEFYDASPDTILSMKNAAVRHNSSSAHKFMATVKAMTWVGVEDVYDVTVSEGNSLIFNGFSTGNCSEILQPQTPSELNDDQTYEVIGKDINCNLGSLNIRKALESPDFGNTIETAFRSLVRVSDLSSIDAVPTVKNGNDTSHSVGLGAMNLHGALTHHRIMYGSEESIDFTNMYFYITTYHAIRVNNMIAREKGETFDTFPTSTYATGEYFDRYINPARESFFTPQTDKVKEIFKDFFIPTKQDWVELAAKVKEHGLYSSHMQAVPPTGSISYINNSTSSIHPVDVPGGIVMARAEGKLGTVYYPTPEAEGNEEFYRGTDMFTIDSRQVIDVYSVAQYYVDQGLSLTLGYRSSATTRNIVQNVMYSFSKGKRALEPILTEGEIAARVAAKNLNPEKAEAELANLTRTEMLKKYPQGEIKTMYYVRMMSEGIEETQNAECVSCML